MDFGCKNTQQSGGDAMKKMKNKSKINPKSIRNGSHIDLKSLEIKVLMHLGGILEASLGASWKHFGMS